MKIEKIKIGDIRVNPKNPRIIKDNKFNKLVKSIKDFPEMLKIRPIVVNDDNVILGGNMRYKACEEAKLTEVYIIKATGLSEKQQQEFLIKDNVGFGDWDWDVLANEWDIENLEEWGLEGFPFEDQIDKLEDGEVLHVEKSLQILPKKEYIVIIADDGSDEWEELKTIFSCGIVRAGGCTKGSTSDKATTGIERIFDFKTFKDKVINGIRNSNTK